MAKAKLEPGTVKICSLREVVQAEYVVAAGADLFGLIFADSRRQITSELAREVVSEARSLAGARQPRPVGVFVNQSAEVINRTADAVGLDFVQLHGSEAPDFADLIERPVIRAFRTGSSFAAEEVDAHLAIAPPGRIVAALVDGYHADQAGGSGAVADWSIARDVAGRHPVLLAGGLTPETVALAIAAARPLGVDVSSGVEVEGRKDRERIFSFVQAARSAFAGLG